VGVRGANVVFDSLLGPALPDLARLYDVSVPHGEELVAASGVFLVVGAAVKVGD
jgi:hypothetical protein